MRKFLRLSLVVLFAIIGTTAFADTYSYTFEETVFKEAGTQELNGIMWTLTTDAGYFGYDNQNDKGQQIGSSGNPATTAVLSSGGINGTITSIKVNTSGASGINATLDVTVGGEAFGEQYELTKTKADVEFTGSASGEIKLIYTNKVEKAIYIKSIEITYEGTVVTKKDANLVFSETSATVVLGEEFTAPVLTKDTDADVVYSSSNEDVATVDATTGEVSIVGVGSTKISATAEETDEYSAGTTSYTLIVTAPALTEVTVPYSESFEYGIGSFTIDDVNKGDLDYVWSHDANYKYMKATSYVNKKNNDAESWLVSPTINLENINEATLEFEQCINKYFGSVDDEATLWIKVDDGEWEQAVITYPAEFNSAGWTSFEKQTVDITSYAGKKIKVGFKYVGSSKTAGTWEIKNFSVTGITSGINDVTVEEEFDENAPVYNLAGQRVSKDAKGIVIQNGKKYIRK